MSDTFAISTENLAVGYKRHTVLSNISITLPAGAFCVLIGPNGSGKSTFLRTVSGLAAPLEGHIFIDGCDINALNAKELAKKLAMVLTDRGGGGAMTVRETVEIGRHPYTGLWGRLSESDDEIVSNALEAVGMTDKADRYIGTLSDGERQKAMIARALCQDTPLILLDEPTAFLDVAGRVEVLRLLGRLAKGGKCVLLSTHDIAPAMEVATHVLAVDPAEATIICGTKTELIESGRINLPFAADGMHYDKIVNDFR